MAVFIFPGQGAQIIGMGRELFDKYETLVREADDILGYSIKSLCLDDPSHQLSHTEYTQPALFVVGALSYLERISTNNQVPSYVAGHSLGEYNALFAANVIDFATGVRLVQKRGALMAGAKNGGMAAVIGFDVNQLKTILNDKQLHAIDIANINTRTQIVISGLKQDIETAKKILEEAGARLVITLDVSGAFHSRYMQNAADEFAELIGKFTFNAPTIKIISNVEAQPVVGPDAFKTLLVEQVTHPVKWYDSIKYLMEQGETEFVELGSGHVLTGLVATIRRGD